jgi:hypothetical protein
MVDTSKGVANTLKAAKKIYKKDELLHLFLVSGHDCELLVWDAVQGDVSALGSLRIQSHHLRQDSIPKKRKSPKGSVSDLGAARTLRFSALWIRIRR